MATIFAEATPPGRGGVSIVRLSGPESRQVAEDLAGALPEARYCYYRSVRDGDDLIDRALVMRFEAGASFTGEESCEFHLHGAPVVVKRLEAALVARGLRRAEAGEFTLRSFTSGQMDLAEVEGLSDLLAAETETQRKLAVEASSGALGRLAEEWREGLVHAGAMITASIDFADEEIPDEVAADVWRVIAGVRSSIAAELAGFPARERLRLGFEVALLGAPNAGKSSLMNAIARRDVAIVTEYAGTTRDVVEFRADLRGLPVIFLDTAGIRETDDMVEGIGIGRARDRAADADLRIFLGPVPDAARDLTRDGDLFIETKGDLTGASGAISSLTGAGVDRLLEQVFDSLRRRLATSGVASHARQAEAMQAAVDALDLPEGLAPELLAEAMREALHHLQRLVGKIDVDDYLDRVFSTFCVGK
ncbi:tRNA uridine-5-carboxymethylaminomethyl(34) synthesis GTPase MnmE [Paracoccus xiamenensis]|uniref:tRNA uridine-5-carboxymethylaminomethyl(34) synthesis GTPase MnmE n=1 Tax=Paracoccus xiamenensis TaxID=2714901 RepID=UPI00140879C2|nr:tRNA uridine-5-carboxymethylaminomethyl(34) synthesis GTPase MnmE [Paracoccus xiamenensis]NHF72936.1 tRNA uridine-5-carboxymethylaminomethyl(34) synthesis GTPase MnmE [Paracoccus xiamenensis]